MIVGMAQAPPARRRWFQFGVATMLALVTLAAVGTYSISTMMIVRNREIAYRNYPIVAWYTDLDPKQPPLFWRLLGANAVSVVSLNSSATDNDIASVKWLFPEARVVTLD
jgi:hypothetical protein